MEEKERFVTEITPKSEDFSRWYTDVVRRAELADYTTVKGCMVIRPYGYATWEKVQECLDRRIKETGHQNAYFPMFIPESLLKKEAEHVEGFAPQVAWVTQGGDEQLEERLAIRPTSEAIICSMYSKWVRSWRDLPILINQWVNIVRWEKETRPFLRTREFLWQEGHTVHATEKEAEEETLKILEVYRDFIENDLAIPLIAGLKTESEKFAGALKTYAVEALMTDGKALQAGTSHHLGQHFAKAFDIKFEDKDQKMKYAWQTSWGVTTRLVGAIIMTHGDDSGLILPPKVAPIHVIIIPIPAAGWQKKVLPLVEEIERRLKGIELRVQADLREVYSPGWKFSEWEMRGVPLRLEIGMKEVAEKRAVAVRRDTGAKMLISLVDLEKEIPLLLAEIQNSLFKKAKKFLQDNTHTVDDYDKFKEIIKTKGGFIYSFWCGDPQCEQKIKEETTATIRALPLKPDHVPGGCVKCGRPSAQRVYFAKAY